MMIDKIKNLFTWPTDMPDASDDFHNWAFDWQHEGGFSYLIDKLKPKIVLEIGSWLGMGSTSYMLKYAPDIHLIALDHWSDDKQDFIGTFYPIEYVERDYSHIENIWNKFLKNTWEFRDRLTPLRRFSSDGLEILKDLNIDIDLIYLDADHGYDSMMYELEKCSEYWPNATLCGDDYEWEDHSVKRAVHTYGDIHKLKVNVIGRRFWFYTKRTNLKMI
jgi:hypothetical protein